MWYPEFHYSHWSTPPCQINYCILLVLIVSWLLRVVFINKACMMWKSHGFRNKDQFRFPLIVVLVTAGKCFASLWRARAEAVSCHLHGSSFKIQDRWPLQLQQIYNSCDPFWLQDRQTLWHFSFARCTIFGRTGLWLQFPLFMHTHLIFALVEQSGVDSERASKVCHKLVLLAPCWVKIVMVIKGWPTLQHFYTHIKKSWWNNLVSSSSK